MEPVGKKQYRYPGVTPFSTGQANIFFGRRQDTDELYRLIRREPLVVLYGKSGLGKSSLLNAGIVPRCLADQTHSPVVVRFGAWMEGKEETLPDIARAALAGAPSLLDTLLPGDRSLWQAAKSRQLNGGGRPLLIFDQFEELFSYPDAQVEAFARELTELVHTDMPLRYQRRLEASSLPEEDEDRLEESLDARIVFAIRSDRMHLLNRLKDQLPMVLRHAYELKALSPRDAEEAIVAPARVGGDFTTAPYAYSPQAIKALLGFLTDPQDGRVEGILLQMLCEHYERRQVEAHGLSALDLPHIGDPGEVVRNYYDEKIRGLAPAQQAPARRLIEDGLVSEGDPMRLSLHEAFIAQEYGVGKALLEALVDSRLLRAEPFLRGGYTYELSHDRLMPAVAEARSARKQEELRLERLKIQRARRRNFLIGAAAMLLLAFAFLQMNNARIANKEAAEKTLEAQEATERATEQQRYADEAQAQAEEQTQKARELDLLASAAELRAQQEQAKAAASKREVAERSVSLVLNILSQADADIYRLDYEAARKKIYSAADLGVEKKKVAQAFMELALWDAETGQLDSAKTTALRAARLLGRSDLAALTQKAAGRTALRSTLQKMDPAHFAFLEARYFPYLVRIPGGTFMMGSAEDDPDNDGDESPPHQVTLTSFGMARTEITFWQFAIFTENNELNIQEFVPDWGIGGGDPVVKVSWYDAANYANWLSSIKNLKPFYIFESGEFAGTDSTANGYRMPSEAQWEYAAGNGSRHTKYSWGDEWPSGKKGGNVADETAKKKNPDWTIFEGYEDGYVFTAPAGSYEANDFGLYDMTGNVWEWCNDWYGDYSEDARVNPAGPLRGSNRVLRGGSWYGEPRDCRVAGRDYWYPGDRYTTLGFRLVLPPVTSE
jgi:formylglycine-generating enzyme required for sulfatase activity